MVIMHGQHESGPNTPTPDEINNALDAVAATPVGPGVWTAALANGRRIRVTAPTSTEAPERRCDRTDEHPPHFHGDGAGRALCHPFTDGGVR
jgi:hypothetical protein